MRGEIYQIKETVMELLNNFICRIDDMVELYSSGEHAGANERVVFLIDDLSALAEGVSALSINDIDIRELNDKLGMLLEQFENEDYFFVSDLLKFELKPLLEKWQEEIRDVH